MEDSIRLWRRPPGGQVEGNRFWVYSRWCSVLERVMWKVFRLRSFVDTQAFFDIGVMLVGRGRVPSSECRHAEQAIDRRRLIHRPIHIKPPT
jgi:hypothetical protein